MHQNTLHMIGNGHIDPVWLWRWQEGFQEIKATFRSALDRLAESEDFIFTASSAAFYEWIEQNDPQMFGEIRERVAEGRWQIVGGWWIQPDCNLPGGESFVRQGLYGQHYFKEKFGVAATVGYNPDSFGHSGMLPQILRKSGLENYVFMRPAPNEKGLPAPLFWWEADDGSRVLTARILYEYGTQPASLERHIRRCAAELRPPLTQLMCFYGVGNHGGGPTKENLATIHRLQGAPDLPELRFSDPNHYFASVRDCLEQGLALPVVHDDLQHHAIGCYSAHSGVKAWNRHSEHLLLAAEAWSAIAARVTGQPASAEFGRAWKNVLFNQFHDILAGSSIEPAYDDARDLYGETNAIASRALNHAVQALAWRVNIPQEDGTTPVVVFNPHAWASTTSVEVDFGGLNDRATLLDDQGRATPLQLVQPHATVSNNSRTRLCFVADLPPRGYRTYGVVARPATAGAPAALPSLVTGETTLENDRYRLTIDPATGHIASLHDKTQAIEVLLGEGA
ncbi:MAG: alpha-mannosidase, partial [Thermomicrobiales bacterium]